MRWGFFLLLLIVAVVLDASFTQVFAIGRVHPSVTPALVVFVAMYANRSTAMWAALVAGLLVDLTTPALFDGTRPYHLIGPTILGFVFGTAIAIPLRTMVVRKNPLAFGFLVAFFALGAMVLITAISSARGWYAGTVPPWMSEEGRVLSWMWLGSLDALATGCLAVLLAWPLQRLGSGFGFAASSPWSSRRG